MSINKIRRVLYRIASFLGDVQAILTGRIIQRLIRKAVFRRVINFINRLIKW